MEEMTTSDCIHFKKNRCFNNKVFTLKLPFPISFLRRRCIEDLYDYGECTLKESLFDLLKGKPESQPAGCVGCSVVFNSEWCLGCLHYTDAMKNRKRNEHKN